MDEKEKDLEKGQRDRRRGTVVEVSGPPRAISPPVPELVIPDLQYYLSSEMPVITPSLPPSSLLCHVGVFVGHYLLFFIPLYQQCSIFKGSHFTHDTNGVSKRPYDTVIIEFHQKHIQSHGKKGII